jgi:Tfp pilus assembly protein PilV
MRRGFTLTEAVIAIFILLASCVTVFTLMDQALRYSAWSEGQLIASLVAEKRLESIRDWAYTLNGTTYNFNGSWGAIDGVFVDPDYPAYTATVNTSWYTLYSPSSALEASYGANARMLTQSVRLVTVTVNATAQGKGTTVTLSGLIGEPERTVRATNPLVVSTVVAPQPIPQGGSGTFRADLFDINDQPIPDVFCSWYVVPQTTNGTVIPDRTSVTSTLYNEYHRTNGLYGYYGPGTLGLQARCVYMGLPYSGEIQPVQFQ